MKTFIKGSILIVAIAIGVSIIYAGVKVGVPYLMAKTEYDRNLPTIKKLQKENDSLMSIIDTLRNKEKLYEMKISLQEELISSQKSSVSIQNKIQSQLKSLEHKLSSSTNSRNENESNGRK